MYFTNRNDSPYHCQARKINVKNKSIFTFFPYCISHVDNIDVCGNVTCVDAYSKTLTVTGASSLQDTTVSSLVVSTDTSLNASAYVAENMTVNGDLTVNGSIYGYEQNSPMETNYVQITGSSGTASGTITLTNNTGNTTDYSVFPSIYYGYSGSDGTYSATATSGSVGPIVISSRTNTTYTWNLSKGTGDNINVYLVFLVVYGLGSDYPSSY